MTEKASSVFPAADVLVYYEESARFSSNDRELIIKEGFQEWLLAVNINHTAGTAAAERRQNMYAPHSVRRVTDLVVLIANLIGGAAYEPIGKD